MQIFRTVGGGLWGDFLPFGSSYRGGISVAVGDVNKDGVKDLVASQTTGNPNVKVYDGTDIINGTFSATADMTTSNADASLLTPEFLAFGASFNIGVSVAVSDVLGDGFADIVTAATAGNPDVRVFSGKDIDNGAFDPTGSSLLAKFFAFGLQFNVGANAAVGDTNGDGFADIVTGASAGNPDVKVYSGKAIANHTFNNFNPDASLLEHFFAYGLNFNIGANVAVGDVNGDGHPDIITGATAGNPDVHVYDGAAIANGTFNQSNPDAANRLDHFFAYDLQFNVGATVAAADIEQNGRFDILTGATAGSPHYRCVRGNSTGIKPPAVNNLDAIANEITGGVRVGA